MARKKKSKETSHIVELTDDIHIEGAGTLVEQPITQTLTKNYMPYAMSVILSRAIPEIDGFKPSHRKLLYSMYLDKLLEGKRAKSAKIVGDVMKLNPHGDSSIYDTMVRLSKGHEALLNPYVDSKGNFGKAYSRDMAYAASRYTEAKLAPICYELFGDINKDTVDFVPNYDNTMTEPTLLPVTFPTVLANVTTGIAVGMASSICSFNLKELCETTIEVLRNKDHVIGDTLMGPDFPGGGYFIYDREALDKVYETGRGGLKIRAKYEYDKKNNCIDITEIPPTATVEAIIDKVVELAKAGTVKEVSDIRDETGMQGLRLTIDLKRGVDPEKLMTKLFKQTQLEDSFPCNFNILVDGTPRVMGVKEIIEQWARFRIECVRRRTAFTRERRAKQLHLLEGLQKILLDIDKAIKIIRETDEEVDVVPNLMIGFGIDKIQAEYVAEIKLRHLNREFILKRTKDIEKIRDEIAALDAILESRSRIKTIIIKELKAVIENYGQERKTKLLYLDDIAEEEEAEEIPDYPVTVFFT
ncbi:MAG: topoisomerase IV, partial [Clostridia bacterium]|nr:topoisomerase IV [Clostridia bacterium]